MTTYKTDKKTALFLADGCEEIEALTVVDLLRRAGIPVTTVSVSERREVTSSHDVTILADALIEDLPFDEFDMLILPGGMPGTTNLGACRKLTDRVKEFAAEGKPVAAICAAPSILARLGILEGKKASCNPSVESILTEGGAILQHSPVTRDGEIITSRAMGTAALFGLEIVRYFLGNDTAENLRNTIILSA